MTCPTIIELSTYVDGELPAPDSATVDAHVATCPRCRETLTLLAAENHALRSALHAVEPQADMPVLVFPRRLRTRFALAVGAALLLAVGVAWQHLGKAVPTSAHWLLGPETAWSLVLEFLAFIIREGRPMLASTFDWAAAAVLLILAATLASVWRRRAVVLRGLALVAVAALATPRHGHAVEIRRDEALVTLEAGETIEDTLMAFGKIIAIDGNVDGDLVAFGGHVTLRGNVTGDVITAAQTITIEGSVGGNVIGFARTINTTQARIARNLYGFGNEVAVGNGVELAGNATLFGNEVQVRGNVGRDVLAFANSVAISGTVARDVQTFSNRATLLPSARIGGDVRARVEREDHLRTAPGATVTGSTRTEVGEDGEPVSKYFTAGFYVWQAVRLGAAFVTGLLLFWIFPSLLHVTIAGLGAGLRAAGIGALVAIGLPIAAILAFVTIIGIPLGIAGFVIWMFGLYFAKIVVAQIIGARLFRSGGELPHHAATLLAGLVIVIIAINLPFIGGLVNVALTLVGLGLLLGRHFVDFGARPFAARAAA